MKTRFIAGVVMALVASGAVLFLPASGLQWIIAGLAGIAAFECAIMLLPEHEPFVKFLVPVSTIFLYLVLVFYNGQVTIPSLSLAAVIILNLIFFIGLSNKIEGLHQQIAASLFSVFYCAICFSFLGLFRNLPLGKQWLFLILGTNFFADTGAYLTGKFLGRRRLAPRLSPNKTVEGFLGGIAFCFVFVLAFKIVFFPQLNWASVLWVPLIVGVFGPVGDIAESLLKRSAGVKDSSKLIPGHGGLLDRVDALMFAAPAVYAYVHFSR